MRGFDLLARWIDWKTISAGWFRRMRLLGLSVAMWLMDNVWIEQRGGVWFVGWNKAGEDQPRWMMPELAINVAGQAEDRGDPELARRLKSAAEDARKRNAVLALPIIPPQDDPPFPLMIA